LRSPLRVSIIASLSGVINQPGFGVEDMHAVILSGARQYRVTEGQTLKLELLEAEVGSSVNFDKVLMVTQGETIQIGKPYLNGCKVIASVIGQGRHKKIHIMKFRRRKHHQKQMGHRQYFTEVKIEKIEA
jgi:large subunit ribosomal protein L21